jgi:hypothetical protein
MPTIMGPTSPSLYRVQLPASSQIQRYQSLTLTVRVTDAQGHAVDDVAVHFRLPAAWSTLATITPPTATTIAGVATTTIRARASGRLALHVQVENVSRLVDITVLGDTPRF